VPPALQPQLHVPEEWQALALALLDVTLLDEGLSGLKRAEHLHSRVEDMSTVRPTFDCAGDLSPVPFLHKPYKEAYRSISSSLSN